jgi:hypothetical protein
VGGHPPDFETVPRCRASFLGLRVYRPAIGRFVHRPSAQKRKAPPIRKAGLFALPGLPGRFTIRYRPIHGEGFNEFLHNTVNNDMPHAITPKQFRSPGVFSQPFDVRVISVRQSAEKMWMADCSFLGEFTASPRRRLIRDDPQTAN